MIRNRNRGMEENRRVISIRSISCEGKRTFPGPSAAGALPTGMAKKFHFLMSIILLVLATHSFGYQEKEHEEAKAKTALTDEEKEMLKDREILENLVLLKNLDAIEFLDLLNEMDPDWSEKDEPVLPEEKTAEKEGESRKP